VTAATQTEADLKPLIQRVVDGFELSFDEAAAALEIIMTGQATAVQVGAFLTALRMRGETVEEIAGFATTMRRHALQVVLSDDARPAIDTCGTGGDGANTFNVSTTAAFVVAGAGVRVAKHGNRSATSKCGSADLLEGLGVAISASPESVSRCIDEAGIGFMFAQAYHPAMKYVGPVRSQLGIRTIFNVLGPVTNPAGVRRQLIGVGNVELARKLAKVLARLGCDRALVVSSADGLDEIAISSETTVVEHDNANGEVRESVISPEHLGLARRSLSQIRGGDVATNVEITRSILRGEAGATRDATLINAGAALYAAGVASTVAEGIGIARDSIDSGRAAESLSRLIETSNRMPA
jgi:anthranilate phosphoribosyltransferase